MMQQIAHIEAERNLFGDAWIVTVKPVGSTDVKTMIVPDSAGFADYDSGTETLVIEVSALNAYDPDGDAWCFQSAGDITYDTAFA